MKKTFTLFRVLLTFVLLCGVGNAWGETATITFKSQTSGSSDGSTAYITTNFVQDAISSSDEAFGTITCNGTAKCYSGKKGYGLKCGASSNNGSFTLTFSKELKNVSKIALNIASYAIDKATTLSVKSGDENLASTKTPSGTSFADWEITDLPINSLSTLTVVSIKYCYIKSITVTYSNKQLDPCTVTFNAGTNGTCSTSSLTEASAGAGITLPSCTANDEYVFKGWSTTENGTTADAGIAGETYKPGSDCTLYAVYNKAYVLTITQPTDGGTLIVSDGANTLSTGDKVEVGTTLTCEVADIPEGLRFSRFYAKWSDDENDKKYKATNPATFDEIPTDISTLKVYVTYMPLEKYTINYMVNGANTDVQENVYEGTALVFPTVTELGGKVFVGWNESEIEEETDVKPTLVETVGLKASENVTYYAVFATFTKGDGVTKTDVLDRSYTGVADGSTSYTSWSKSSSNSGAAYAGNSAGSNNSIQLRWNSDESKRAGIVSTVSGGIAKKITVNWQSNTTNGRTLNVYGSNTAFTSWEDVKTISSAPIGTIVMGTNTTVDIDGDYQYIALRSDAGAMYLTSISIDWVQGTPDFYSAYCTTVLPQTQNVTISPAGYATAYIPFNATVSNEANDVKAYFVTVEGTTAKLNEIEGTIPANTGMVLKGTEGTVTFTESAATPANVEGNLLIGTADKDGAIFAKDNTTYYILSSVGDKVGFYWDASTNNSGATANCAQYKAVLAVPASTAPSFFTFDDATAINVIGNAKVSSVRYNLNGQAVGADYKGIVIVNGKKMFNK